MRKSELRQIIKEEVENIKINEGILSAIFGKIGASQAKKVEKKLASDPEYKELQQDIQRLKNNVKKIKDKYKDDEFFSKVL